MRNVLSDFFSFLAYLFSIFFIEKLERMWIWKTYLSGYLSFDLNCPIFHQTFSSHAGLDPIKLRCRTEDTLFIYIFWPVI